MKVIGLMCVRNEADILEINIRYHLALGIDRLLVIDNGSDDETGRVLSSLARSLPVEWCRRAGEFRQLDIMSRLAYEAYLRGADWLVPIDADEFWYAPRRGFREILRETAAGVLLASVVNYVQTREQAVSRAEGLLTMTRRPPAPIGPISRIEEMVTTQQIGFVEIEYPPKCLARASAATRIGQGNHWIEFAPGEQRTTDEVVCLHAPMRSRAQLDRKTDSGRNPEELVHYRKFAWHQRWWQRLAGEGRLDEEWAANSYGADGTLEIRGSRRPTLHDETLARVVAPFVAVATAPAAIDADTVETLALEQSIPYEFISDVVSRVAGIQGWLLEADAVLLMTTTICTLLERPADAIVEIGSYCGKSTVAIASVASAVNPAARIYAIDPHEGFISSADTAGVLGTFPTWQTFQRNIHEARLDEVVNPVVKRSEEVTWTEPIGMLFIDGLHDYENVSRDYAAFIPYVVPGGYVLFDDYAGDFPGVIRFVDERESSGELEFMTQSRRIRLMRKAAAAPAASSMAHNRESGDTPVENQPEMNACGNTEQDLQNRLDAHAKGVQLLRQLLFREGERHREELAGSHARIVAQQAELFEKVGERDRYISALQAELHEKVAERDQLIRATQAELHEKVAERDKIIAHLQRELSTR